jgi:hypothetical protein
MKRIEEECEDLTLLLSTLDGSNRMNEAASAHMKPKTGSLAVAILDLDGRMDG